MPAPARPTPDQCPIADITERLMAEFSGTVDCARVSRAVLTCHHELHDAPVAALPELVERLARQRLIDETHVTPEAGPPA